MKTQFLCTNGNLFNYLKFCILGSSADALHKLCLILRMVKRVDVERFNRKAGLGYG